MDGVVHKCSQSYFDVLAFQFILKDFGQACSMCFNVYFCLHQKNVSCAVAQHISMELCS